MTMMSEAGVGASEVSKESGEFTLPTAMIASVATSQEVNLMELNPDELTPEEASSITGLPIVAEGYLGEPVYRNARQIIGMAIFRELGYTPGNPECMMGKTVQQTYMEQAALRSHTAERRARKSADVAALSEGEKPLGLK